MQISQLNKALEDIKYGVKNAPTIFKLALLDIKLRYRGSSLGPLWIVVATAIQIISLSFIYPFILGCDQKDYIKWLCCSIIPWNFIAGPINESCSVFLNAKASYLSNKKPFSFFIMKFLFNQQLVFFHQLSVFVIVFYYFNIYFSFLNLLAFMAAFILISLIIISASIFLGILSLKYNDIPQLSSIIMNMMFLITPVFWIPGAIKHELSFLIKFNPLYYLLESLRGPLLGHPFDSYNFMILLLICALAMLISFTIFVVLRKKISIL